jgi:hypothetical protein
MEYDSDGELVWPVVIVSAPRQTGKSWLERMVCAWRMAQGSRFGEEQNVMHVAHKLVAAQEVWRPAARASLRAGASVRWANGEQQIELADGSRWMIQAANDGSGVAFSLSMVLVDEAWRVPRQVLDDALAPTLAESVAPQTWLVSTAGTSESDLMLSNRAGAIASADAGHSGRALLLEWSAPPEAELDIDDWRTARDASPHWDDRRRSAVERARDQSDERSFRQQWLNQWVPSERAALVEPVRWQALATLAAPADPVTFGVDVSPDRSYAVVCAYGGGVAELVAAGAPGAATGPGIGQGVGWVVPWFTERRDAHGGAWVVGVDMSGPAAPVGDALRQAIGADRVVAMSGRDAATASGQLYDRMTSYPVAVLFRAHPEIEASVLGARWRNYGATRTFARDDNGGVSGVPLIAASCAVWAAEHAALFEEGAVF